MKIAIRIVRTATKLLYSTVGKIIHEGGMWTLVGLTGCGLVIIGRSTLLSHCEEARAMQDSMGEMREWRNEEDSTEQ
jgi:ABC-type uncharacterized transport system YnjBCD ATPase subunit